jgi:hypothetical protein
VSADEAPDTDDLDVDEPGDDYEPHGWHQAQARYEEHLIGRTRGGER